MTKKIKKAILDFEAVDRFLPLPEEVPVELRLIDDKPLLFHLVDEILELGVERVFFLKKESRLINVFKNLEKAEEKFKKEGWSAAGRMKEIRKRYENLSFSYMESLQKASKGEGNFVYLSAGELFHSKEKSAPNQLMEVFRTSERPVVGLKEAEMGDLEVEKIARGLFKVKSFQEESTHKLLGRAVFTDKSRKFFKKDNFRDNLKLMIKRGHTVYGSKLEGNHFDLNSFESFLKARSFYMLKSDKKEILKNFLKRRDLLE